MLNLLYPFVWFSTEFRGRVVDESTGRPVANAIVLANWELLGGLVHPSTQGQLAVSEVTTGTDGVFRIPAWGPRFVFGLGGLDTTEPHFRVLSHEHYPLIFSNQPKPMTAENYGRAGLVIRFLYQDQDLLLKPRGSDLAAYEQAYGYLVRTLSFIYFDIHRECNWRSAPRTLAFIHRLKEELSQHGRGADLYYVHQLGEKAHCGKPDPVELARKYIPSN